PNNFSKKMKELIVVTLRWMSDYKFYVCLFFLLCLTSEQQVKFQKRGFFLHWLLPLLQILLKTVAFFPHAPHISVFFLRYPHYLKRNILCPGVQENLFLHKQHFG